MFCVSGSGLTGNGCVGDACSPGTSLFGTGRSSMSKIGLPVTRLSVNINPVLLTMMTAGTVCPVAAQVDEQRRRLGVVVPDVVVHELEVPEILAGVRIDRDHRRGEQIVAGTVDADAVVVRGAERHVENAALRIERRVAPDVDAGTVLRAVSAPGVVAELARPRHGVERPHQLAGPGVPGARIARGSGSGIGAARPFAGARAGDDQILVDGRRRQQRVGDVRAGLHDLGRLEGDDAVLAKPLVERAVRRLERVELAGRRPEDDRRRERERPPPPGQYGDAALGRQLVVGKLKSPFLRAGRGVQRDDGAVRRAEIHRVADHDGNGFVFAHRAGVAGGLEMKAPDLLQRADILRRDLGQRAVAVGGLIVVGARPVGGAGRPSRGADGGRGQRHAAQATPKASLEVNLAMVPLPSNAAWWRLYLVGGIIVQAAQQWDAFPDWSAGPASRGALLMPRFVSHVFV